jgi:predicted nucleic acid-binding protein
VKPYLLGTNIISYFIRDYQQALVERVTQVLTNQTAAISVITQAELRFGQAGMVAADKRRLVIDLVLTQVSVLPWTSAAADIYGTLKWQNKRQGTPVREMDTQIAAHALAEKLILVTHNTRHFENIPGLKLEDWLL